MSLVQVWDALETAGKVFLEHTKDTTVGVMHHKYGDKVAETTADGFGIALDAVQTVYNVKQLGAKKIIRNTAKETVIQTGKKILDTNEK